MFHREHCGLTLEVGVGSPGLLKISWTTKVKKPALVEGWRKMRELLSWQMPPMGVVGGAADEGRGSRATRSLHAALVIYLECWLG